LWIDIGAVEAGAEHGGIGHLTTVAAADAGLVDMGDGIVAQRVAGVLQAQRGAAGQAHAGVVAGADRLVHAEAGGLDPAALLDRGLAFSGFSRRCLFSMHSDEATMTFGPFSAWSAPRASCRAVSATS
jgi:hypothetical protein